jgi:nucleotide-binding universal stress UspA family protein
MAFVHVIKAHGYPESGSPVDPVEWEIMRREAKAHMAQFVQKHADGDETLATHLLEGRGAEQICRALASRPQDIAVLGRGHGESAVHIGETARQMLETGVNSLLLVPGRHRAKARNSPESWCRWTAPDDRSGSCRWSRRLPGRTTPS